MLILTLGLQIQLIGLSVKLLTLLLDFQQFRLVLARTYACAEVDAEH